MSLLGRIRMAMAWKGWDKDEFARQIKIRRPNMHRQTVHKWFDDEVEHLSLKNLFLVSDVLDCNPRWLGLREGEPQKPVELDLEKNKVLQLYDALSNHPNVRDAWIKHGGELLQVSTGQSVAQPFKF